MKNKTQLASIALTSMTLVALTATPALAGYGSSPSTTEAPRCEKEAPAKPSFSFVRRSGNSEIEIGWNQTDRATKWTVAYGNEKGKYIYGMSDFGDSNSRSVKIAMLPTGTYYVVVKAINECMPGQFSDERKMTVFSNGNVLGAKTFRPFGEVLGSKDAKVSPTPSASPKNEEASTPAPSATPEAKQLNWFQRLIQFLFGK